MKTQFGASRLFVLTLALAICFRAPAEQETNLLRVMTWNIHHGEGLDGKVDLEHFSRLIRSERADIVALQEVDKGVERTGRRDFPAELGRLTGMSCVFSNNYDYQGGEYGNAVLTRFPIKRSANYHYQKVNETEQRGLLQLVLDVYGRELAFLVTHLDHRASDAARWSNVGEIERVLQSYHGLPIIFCGDFNTQPSGRVYTRLKEQLDDTWVLAGNGDGCTIPAEAPSRRIDYIWFNRSKALVPLKSWVPESLASDHRPVVTEFQVGVQVGRRSRRREEADSRERATAPPPHVGGYGLD